MPELVPGEVLLISADELAVLGGLWSLRCGSVARPLTGVPFNDAPAWETARRVVPETLPLLWRGLEEVSSPSVALRVSGDPDHRVSVLSGTSYGLSLLLGLASYVLDTPLPSSVAASATVDERGRLGRVEGLDAKARQLVRWAPSVRTFVVARMQEKEANEALATARLEAERDGVQLDPEQGCAALGVDTAHEAVAAVLQDLEARWCATPPPARAARVRSLLELALSHRGATSRWAAVRRAAELGLGAWNASLTHEECESLHLAAAIAARHDSDASSPALELPSPSTIRTWPQPQRLERLAHLTQHAADTGSPGPEGVLLQLEDHLPDDDSDLFPQHLELVGARGRLLATLGRHEESIQAQRRAAEGWLARPGCAGLSYPLAELYRLAAALGRPELLVEAEELHRRGDALLPAHARPYPTLQRARALLVLRTDATSEAVEGIQSLVDHPQFGPSAARWLRWAARRGGLVGLSVTSIDNWLVGRAAELQDRFDRAPSTAQRSALEHALRHVRTQQVLGALDDRLHVRGPSDPAGALQTLEALRALHRVLVDLLLRWRPGSADEVEYVRRFFPY